MLVGQQTVFRLVFFAEFHGAAQALSISDQSMSYLTGLRFDSLVAAYTLGPFAILILLWQLAKTKVTQSLDMILLGGFVVISFTLLLLNHLDARSMLIFGNRFFADGLKQKNFIELFSSSSPNMFDHLRILGSLIGIALAWRVTHRRSTTLENESKMKTLGSVLVLVILARGSLGSHHLDLRHAKFSENKFAELLTLNSAYCLDQAMKGRR